MSKAVIAVLQQERDRARQENAELREALDEARAVITEANNSLYGSHGYFLSIGDEPADKHHLSRPIEELKARANREWRRAEALAAKVPAQ